MEGPSIHDEELAGVIPRTVREIFFAVAEAPDSVEFVIKVRRMLHGAPEGEREREMERKRDGENRDVRETRAKETERREASRATEEPDTHSVLLFRKLGCSLRECLSGRSASAFLRLTLFFSLCWKFLGWFVLEVFLS